MNRDRVLEIQKLSKSWLPLTDNPNAPNNNGVTPSAVAKSEEIRRILETFKISQNCKAGPSKK